MSRMKKKLMLYFILVAIVSLSVSGEIILEVSSAKIEKQITHNFFLELQKLPPTVKAEEIEDKIDAGKVFFPIYDLRNRMLLLLLVVFGCIVGAFFMFIKDIVAPMDGMVEATKKLAEGDLTVEVPVISEDEIGQIGGLINEMNAKLLDMINQVKQDISRHKDKVTVAQNMMSDIMTETKSGEIIEHKRMRVSEFREMLKLVGDVSSLLEMMTADLTSLETFVNMYKTYKIKSEISQDEIFEAMENYSRTLNGKKEEEE